MALQSSGQIKMSELNTEFGLAPEREITLKSASDGTIAAINTANAAADRPDGTAPHAISEFYSYNHTLSSWSNSYALDYDGVNDYVRGSLSSHPSQEFSISMWVRNDETSKRNMFLYSTVHTENNSTNGRFAFFYNASLNRLIVQFFYNSGTAQRYQRQYPLHDSGNSTPSGVTNSSTGWVSGQRGNTDSDGFTHLMVCIDQTQSNSTNGIKTYWNGSELTYSVNNTAHFTTAQVTHNYLSIGDNYGATAPNSMWDGVIDEVYLYDAMLSSSNVSTIYGYGRDSENTFTTNYETSWRMENDVSDDSGISSLTNNGATFITSP